MPKESFIKINDNDRGIPIDLLSIPRHYKEHLDYVLIPHGLILDSKRLRIEALATQIFNDCNDQPLICLCVLKSGYKFFSNLTEKIQSRNKTNRMKSIPMKLDFIQNLNDEIKIEGLCDFSNIRDQNVLVVDNIVESGNTLLKLINTLKLYNPLSIKSCRIEYFKLVFLVVGFEIPNKSLVVGYALDLNEYFRDLEHICLVKSSSIDKFNK